MECLSEQKSILRSFSLYSILNLPKVIDQIVENKTPKLNRPTRMSSTTGALDVIMTGVANLFAIESYLMSIE